MIESIRGIECSLYNGRVGDLLFYIANNPFDFYIQSCMKIDDKNMILPRLLGDFRISPRDLKRMAKEDSIWELVLHVYPSGSANQTIETYDDFIKSSCVCCLIFYDCGLLEIYVKESNLRERLWDLLLSIGAEDMELKTDSSDGRICLTV